MKRLKLQLEYDPKMLFETAIWYDTYTSMIQKCCSMQLYDTIHTHIWHGDFFCTYWWRVPYSLHSMCSMIVMNVYLTLIHVSYLFKMLLQVAVVTVAFPATPLLLARARICISASHTREDLIKALEVRHLLQFDYYSAFRHTDSNFILIECIILHSASHSINPQSGCNWIHYA